METNSNVNQSKENISSFDNNEDKFKLDNETKIRLLHEMTELNRNNNMHKNYNRNSINFTI